MKANEIKVGGLYTAKVNGALTTVRVDAIREGRGLKGNATYYDVTNTRTGRKTMFRSAAKFRSEQSPFAKPAGSATGSAPAAEGEQRTDPTPPASDAVTSSVATAPKASPLTSPLASRLSAMAPTMNTDDSPHVIVEARAGTGKTTTLIEGLKLLKGGESALTPSPQQRAVWDAICLSRGKASSVCFVAFNKSIATELQARVPAGCDAMTMHSLGYRAVTRALGRQEPTQWVVQDYIAELLGMDGREAKRKKGPTMQAVEELVSLCKTNLIAASKTEHDSIVDWSEELDQLASHYDVEFNGNRAEVYRLVPQVLERCKQPKGKITFDDMIWLPVVLNLPVQRYDLLLVDEAQDLNRCQQALAKKAGHRLILVGDPKQAIYGFAGADSESMPRMAKELGGFQNGCPKCGSYNGGCDPNLHERAVICGNCKYMERGCMTLPLTVTRRCGKAIVDEARKLVPDFEAHESNPAGLIRTAKRVTKERPVVKPGEDYSTQIGPGDFALCRINAPLVSECFKFIRQGRKANIQGRDVGAGLVKTIDKLSGKNDSMLLPAFVAALSDWLAAETAKEMAKRNPSETRLTGLQDRHDCLLCFGEGAATCGDMKRKIGEVFTDDRTSPGIKLSSIHKAKGLEARRVFILEANFGRRDRMQPWEVEQESNLRYVAITRAIEELTYVG